MELRLPIGKSPKGQIQWPRVEGLKFGMNTIRVASLSIILLLGLTSCGNVKNQEPTSSQSHSSAKSSQLKPSSAPAQCTYAEKISGLNLISSQLRAFEKTDLNKAYSYASANFKKNVSYDQFSVIISDQYPMLLSLKNFSVDSCLTKYQLYEFTVNAQDTAGVKFKLYYLLTDFSNTWGVEGVQLTA